MRTLKTLTFKETISFIITYQAKSWLFVLARTIISNLYSELLSNGRKLRRMV